ncbi:Aspartate/alanine antiporter [Planctomycetes bacterium K23_9]|uniref:Aspartate/alanine antiporter n=1 Tax=Stieleria marina TaxID=1930275 RepID=A0A517NVU4_9BACT|nr:Aspartate/alanine antiporter [Planctomycetes bacterium K23_9]
MRGIGLGSAGVLFAGIVFGHFGMTVDHEIAHFAKEFGLVLFVFTIGLQLGPGIIRLWKAQGFLLNGLAVAIVAMGGALVVGFDYLIGLAPGSGPGLFCGATTNTPALGAAQQAAASLAPDSEISVDTLASAYAVAYPGGILGIITSMLLLRRLFKVDVDAEAEKAEQASGTKNDPLERRSLLVTNDRIGSIAFGSLPGVDETGVRISRIQRHEQTEVQHATEETTMQVGDIVQVVGTPQELARFEPLVGRQSDVDLMETPGDVVYRRVVVTEPSVLNHSLRELSLDKIYSTTVTRVMRSGVEMTPRGSMRFQYGDITHIVGDKDGVERVSKVMGNSLKSLDETQFASLFFGVAVGVAVGMIPIALPGLPFPVKLGLAGGPLIAAILFSLVGHLGGLIWYIPYSANLALRELGILLFLASAGLGAGETFFSIVFTLDGMKWVLAGIVIAMLPLLTVGIVARKAFNLNYLTLCGVFAGSMTDPPALAFANSLSDSQTSATAYAAVYPLTMILRIVAAQILVYLLLS